MASAEALGRELRQVPGVAWLSRLSGNMSDTEWKKVPPREAGILHMKISTRRLRGERNGMNGQFV